MVQAQVTLPDPETVAAIRCALKDSIATDTARAERYPAVRKQWLAYVAASERALAAMDHLEWVLEPTLSLK